MQPIIHRRKYQRRAYLKRFQADVIHIHQGPLRAPELGRTRNGGEPAHKYHTFALKARNQAASQTFGTTAHHDLFSNKSPWQGALRNQGMDDVHHIVFDQGRHNTLFYYFVRQEHWFVEVKQLGNMLRRSVTYASRELLIQAFRNDFIIWDETQKLDSVERKANVEA